MTEHRVAFGFPVAGWHEWFAWHPVQCWDYRWIWFRTVRRRAIQKHDYMPAECPTWWWEYEVIDA